MGKHDKIKKTIMSGQHDNNIRFRDIQKLLADLNFSYRIKGDHFIYSKHNVPDLVTLQPDKNGMVRSYQVVQVRRLLKKYKL